MLREPEEEDNNDPSSAVRRRSKSVLPDEGSVAVSRRSFLSVKDVEEIAEGKEGLTRVGCFIAE